MRRYGPGATRVAAFTTAIGTAGILFACRPDLGRFAEEDGCVGTTGQISSRSNLRLARQTQVIDE